MGKKDNVIHRDMTLNAGITACGLGMGSKSNQLTHDDEEVTCPVCISFLDLEKDKKETSAYKNSEEGKIIRKGLRKWRLSFKWQKPFFHRCPYCHSTDTFHKERMEKLEYEFQRTGRLYENCFDMKRRKTHNSIIVTKYDLCLDCGRDFVMEMFCWEKVGNLGVKFLQFDTGKIKTGKFWK